VTAIVDTGPLVALLDARDPHHAWARETLRRLETPLMTCEAVLSEACFLLTGSKAAAMPSSRS
jgi:predicted nucleic acid-binding protein